MRVYRIDYVNLNTTIREAVNLPDGLWQHQSHLHALLGSYEIAEILSFKTDLQSRYKVSSFKPN